jgi:hypothetical protein
MSSSGSVGWWSWQADDDGVLNPANIRLVPGVVIPKAVGSAGLQPLTPPGRFDVSELLLADYRGRIQNAHFVSSLPEREMTATETAERIRENQKRLRGQFGQLYQEFVRPLVLRVLDLAFDMGLIPEDARPIVSELDVRVIGPLKRVMREERAMQRLGKLGALAQTVGPDMMLGMLNIPKVAREIGEDLGLPADWLKTEDEIADMIENAEKAAMEQRQAEMAMQEEGAVAA